MTASFAEIIASLLRGLGIGAAHTAPTWATFVGYLPDQPDEALGVYNTAGTTEGRIMVSGERVEHPGFQVVVRGLNYTTTYQKAVDTAVALDAQRRMRIAVTGKGAYILHNVTRTGTIIPLGVQEEGSRRRHVFTINGIGTFEPTQ